MAEELVRGMTYVPEGEKAPENLGLVRGMVYDEEKRYLILLVGENRDTDASQFKDWVFEVGRQKAYDFIKTMVTSDYVYIDVHESLIISNAEKVTIDKAISIFSFMKTMKDSGVITDDTSFDITDYAYTDEEENDEDAKHE